MEWRNKNRDRYLSKNKEWRDSNKLKLDQKRKEWRDKNPKYNARYSSEWRYEFPEKNRSSSSKRRATKLKATPNWLSKTHLKEIEIIYKRAKDLELEDGIRRHVDHIIPLTSKLVCGLHVPWNLQILTDLENLTKSNKLGE